MVCSLAKPNDRIPFQHVCIAAHPGAYPPPDASAPHQSPVQLSKTWRPALRFLEEPYTSP